jgi:hypothetical protein
MGQYFSKFVTIVEADRIRNFKPDRTGPDQDEMIRITEKKFWVFREFRTDWPAPSLH